MTYGFLILFAFVRAISYQNWFVNVDLDNLQLFIIIAYHLNAHIILLRYVIWEVRIMSYFLTLVNESVIDFQ